MVFNMKRKEIILGVIGIVVIVVVAFFIANLIHDYHVDSLSNENKDKENVEDKIEVNGTEVLFKTYKVDGIFFLNVPDNYIKLSDEELKAKYNYNERPELVFMSELDSEHVFISTTDQDMTDDGLEAYLPGDGKGEVGGLWSMYGVYYWTCNQKTEVAGYSFVLRDDYEENGVRGWYTFSMNFTGAKTMARPVRCIVE